MDQKTKADLQIKLPALLFFILSSSIYQYLILIYFIQQKLDFYKIILFDDCETINSFNFLNLDFPAGSNTQYFD